MITPYQLTTLYVSQACGNDNWSGFYPAPNEKNQGPVKTLEKALERVAEMRRIGLDQPVTVRLVDSEYFVSEPIVITEEMYGITIDSEGGCVISGGRKIDGFVQDTFNGHPCFSAPLPEGLWFTDFYVDGLRADITHYPKEGTLEPEEVENNSTALTASSSWFIAKKEDLEVIKTFRNFGDCYISYNHFWIDEHSSVKSYDLKTGKIEFTYPSRFTVEPTHEPSALHYVIENVAEEFCNKNEWYADREGGRIYYIPKEESQTPQSIAAFAPVTGQLVTVRGRAEKKVKNVIFRNLTFAHTKGEYSSKTSVLGEVYPDHPGFASDAQAVAWAPGSLSFVHAQNCQITECTLQNLGIHGIDILEGCHSIRVTDNDFYDLGAGGIKVNGGVAGSDKTVHTYGNVISDNVITHCGRRYLSACGILIKNSYENTVSHNTVSDLFYTGISVGWVWDYGPSVTRDNLIEANHIYNIGQGVLSDMGGIYLLGKQPGTAVRRNLIHDVVSAHYNGHGIYTDQASSYITIEQNICYRLKCCALHQNFGAMNTVRNNIFAYSEGVPVHVKQSEFHTGLLCERNIIVSSGTTVFQPCSPDWKGDEGAVHMIHAERNLLFDTKRETKLLRIGKKEYTLEEAREQVGWETTGIAADPEFVDPDCDNFTLKETSPAFSLGFQRISMEDVGARR